MTDLKTEFRGKNALVLGGTGAIGAALTDALGRFMAVEALSRRDNGFDITQEASVAAWAGRLTGPYHLIFNATGALEIEGAAPEKALGALAPEAFLEQVKLNALGPALALKHLSPMLAEGRAIFASLSARVGSIGDNGLGGWYSYRAAKAAQNQLLHTAAIEIGRKRKEAVVVALHPGTVTSDLTRKYLGRHPSGGPAEAAENLIRVLGGLTPEQSGGFFDWKGEPVPW